MKTRSPLYWVRLACALGVAVLLGYLLLGPKPWSLRLAPDRPLKIHDYAVIYEWWAAAINLLLLAGLGLTASWWIGRPSSATAAWLPAVGTPRWFWPLVVCAMLLSAYWGSKRIGMSIWDDEDSSLRRAVIGQYRRDAAGHVKFKAASWESALWNYWKPANHQLQTVLSKACLDCWRSFAHPSGLQFNEPVARFPCYIAGVLALGALALLLKRLGFPLAGVLAAFLLALHPWHIRYLVELRGYIFTVLFGPLMVYCLLRAIDEGRWRWWVGFAAAEFCLLYAYPGCLYMAAAANLCGLLALWLRHSSGEARREQIPRLLVASLAAGMLYLQLMLPCVPQLINYFHTERALGALTSRWHGNMAAHLLTGIPWNNSDNASDGYPELLWIAQAHPPGFFLFAGGMLALLLAGLIRLGLLRPAGWLVLAILLVPGPLVYLVSRAKNQYLYEWYLFFSLAGLVAAVALGMDWLAAAAGRLRPVLSPVVALALVGAFAAATQPERRWMTTHPLQPMREAVLLTRPTLDPYDPRQKGIITLSITGVPVSYDANVIVVSSVAELTAELREADRSGRTLYMNYANGWAAASQAPDVHAMIEDDRLFEKTATLKGFDPTLTTFVRKYRPGSIEHYSPSPR